MSEAWIDPEPVPPEGGPEDAVPLTSDQIASWRERGFAFVDGLLPEALLDQALSDARAHFPEPGSAEAEATNDFGSGGAMTFPSVSEAANAITLHPRLLNAIAALLDVPVRELRLTQSDLWAKYGRAERTGGVLDNDDQRIHVDYPNHTLTHPPPWETPEAVEVLLYLGDVDDCEGATAVVPREGPDDPAYGWPIVHNPGVGELRWRNDRESAEAYLEKWAPESARFRREHLYPRARRVRYRMGSTLLYRHDTWHRGTPLRAGAMRVAHNLTFRKAASEWISTLHAGWAWDMYARGGAFARLLARLDVDQRCVLGFPAPGAAYWNPQTLDAVEARFGPLGMDMAPYRSGGAAQGR